VRATDGSYGSAVGVSSHTATSSYTYAPVLLMRVGPPGDEAIHLYSTYVDPSAGDTIACWRSVDDGATWTLQTADTGIVFTTTLGIRWLAGCYLPGGEVALFISYEDGTSTVARQFRSSDNGMSFTPVAASQSGRCVWSCVFAGGLAHVLYTRNDSGAKTNIVRLGSAQNPWADESDRLDSDVAADFVAGGCLVAESTGRIWARVCGENTNDVAVYRSDDYGASWTDAGSHDHANNFGPSFQSGVEVRGQTILYSTTYDGNAGTIDGDLFEVVYGGLTDATLSSIVALPNISWWPMQRLDQDGFSTTGDTGTPTRTLTDDYQETICTAGNAAQDARTVAVSTANHAVAARVVMRTMSGTGTIRVDAGATDVQVDVTSTQIRAYEVGSTAPSYTDHNASGGFIDIILAVRSADGRAVVLYRDFDRAERRSYTQLTTLSGLTTGTGIAVLYLLTSDPGTTRWKAVQAGVGQSFGGGMLDGVDRPDDLDGIPVAVTGWSYLGGGVFARADGGPFVVDGSSYTLPVTAKNPKAAVLPQVVPSPTNGLVTSSGGAATLRFTADAAAGSLSAYAPPGLWAVLLDGLVGIGDVDVYDDASGSVLGSFARIPWMYEMAGGVVRTDTTGPATAPDAYVRSNELAGWYLETANGKVRRIRGNTDGHFDGTDTGHGCTLFLDGFDGSETARGSGYLYPRRILFLLYGRGVRAMSQLRLVCASHTAFDAKHVGLVAAGPVQVMGRACDRTLSVSVEDGASLSVLPDGSTVRSALQSTRRRYEFGIGLDSHVDVSNVYLDMASLPDHVTVSAHASAKPAATRFATPLSVEGMYEQLDGRPFVFLPVIPRDTGTGNRAIAHVWNQALMAVYGRLVNTSRRTMVGGRRGVTGGAMWRSSTIAINEER
jgi:hypothetical protein